MATRDPIGILGAGIAGLACGHYLRRAGEPFFIVEARPRVGGNAVTLERAGFRFDSGAHRFHDKDREITTDVMALLGDELQRVTAPSQISYRGRLLDFPLAPLNLLRAVGPVTLARATGDLLWRRSRPQPAQLSFEALVTRRYGRALAEPLLLSYSAKLWGVPCSRLSPEVAGGRLGGLNLATLTRDVLLGNPRAAAHLEGAFHYPRTGFGALADALADSCGREHIRTDSRVVQVIHDQGRIKAIRLRGGETLAVGRLINTLPISAFVRLLEPTASAPVLAAASRLRFRDLKLVVILLDRERVTNNATVYFPAPELPFTRITEPNNRSRLMSPPGKTSLVVEVPCQRARSSDGSDAELVARVQAALVELGWIVSDEVIGTHVIDMSSAYPVLEINARPQLAELRRSLLSLANLRSCGRSARFEYLHCHEIMRHAKELAKELGREHYKRLLAGHADLVHATA